VEADPREIDYYITDQESVPFLDWLYSLKDIRARAAIRIRIRRVSLGNFGDHRSVGDGVSELRIDSGVGYRVYYGHDRDKIILILCGGDKKTQTKDIKRAKGYWEDYKKKEK